MATVSGLFMSPGRKSGVCTPHERAAAIACRELAVGDELSLR